MELGLAPTEDGKVICLRCRKTCSSMQTASIHFKEIHLVDKSNKKFKCIYCPYSTAIKRYYNDHLFRQHKVRAGWLKKQVVPKNLATSPKKKTVEPKAELLKKQVVPKNLVTSPKKKTV